METERAKENKWTYLRDRMKRIYDRAGCLILILGMLLVLYVTFSSDNWLQTLWRGLLIILTRGRSDPAG